MVELVPRGLNSRRSSSGAQRHRAAPSSSLAREVDGARVTPVPLRLIADPVQDLLWTTTGGYSQPAGLLQGASTVRGQPLWHPAGDSRGSPHPDGGRWWCSRHPGQHPPGRYPKPQH